MPYTPEQIALAEEDWQIAIIEKACAAWWDIEHNGKPVATFPWGHPHIKDEWKEDYRERMKAALRAAGAIP